MRLLSMLALLGLVTSCSSPVLPAPQESASGAPEKAAETAQRRPSVPPSTALPSIQVGEHVFERRLLGNGLRAVAARDADEGVSVFVIVAAGKRHETPETTGLAHLTEHAMYTGTAKTGPDEHDRLIEQMGGSSNAFTREDYTLFYDHEIPLEKLDEVLAMEADRLRHLSFDEQAVLLERERLRIEEEKTWQPSQVLTELLEAEVFQRHPYGAGIIDEHGHTLAPGLDPSQIREFYDRHYHPRSVAVVVAGAIEPSRALDAIERAFGALPAGPPPVPLPEEPEISEPRSVSIPTELRRDRLEWVWLVPALGHPDRPALDLLARLLSRRTTKAGGPIFASMGARVDKDLFRLAATGPSASADLEAVLNSLYAGEIEAAEIEEVKGLLGKTFRTRPLRGRPYFALAASFGTCEVLGHAEEMATYEAAIARLGADEVLRVARQYLSPDKRVSILFVGTGAELEPLPDDRTELQRAAVEAAQAGDLDRAIAAYDKLLAGDQSKMGEVIALADRGKLRMQQRDYDAAIQDLERALEIVDYPDLRNLLDEARALEAGVVPEGVGDEDVERHPAPEADVPDPPLEESEVFYDEQIREFEPDRLGNGVFIVATGKLATSMFAESVILITHYESGGTMGLTVNRPSEIPLSKAFPDIERLQGESDALFLGGPVRPRAVFALLQSDQPQVGMERVAEGIYFSRGLDPMLEDPSRDLSGDSTRVFAGYTGWAPGQLEAEIERGDWIVAWENPAVAFTRDVKKLWRKLLESWSGRWT
ncbi:MAG: YqgE/AlgH family protein [Deltaproteobacteria bacterium]|nr:YqgE/AlgH family protein [Deltaproteobacteria bacterium]